MKKLILSFILFMVPAVASAALPTDISDLYEWYDADFDIYDSTTGGSAVTADGAKVKRWEGQVNSRHLTQLHTASAPVYDATKGLIVSEGYLGANEVFLTTANFTLNRQNFSVFAIVEATSFYYSMIGVSVGANNIMFRSASDTLNWYWPTTGRQTIFNSSVKSGGAASTVPSHRSLIGVVGNGSNLVFWVNGSSSTATVATAGSSTIESFLGSSVDLQGTSQVGVKDIIVYSKALSQSEVLDTLLVYAQDRGVNLDSPAIKVIGIGDSITHGYGTTVNRTWMNRSGINDDYKVYMMARSGGTLDNFNTDKASILDPITETGDVAVVFAGTNDLVSVSSTVAHGRLQTLCSGLRSDGLKVIVVNALDRNLTAGRLDGFNLLISTSYHQYADYFVNAHDHPSLDDRTDTNFYLADQIHPNDAGTQVLADLILPAVLNFLPPLDHSPTILRGATIRNATLRGVQE